MSQLNPQLVRLSDDIAKMRVPTAVAAGGAQDKQDKQVCKDARPALPKHQSSARAAQSGSVKYSSFGRDRLYQVGEEVQKASCRSDRDRVILWIYQVVKRAIDMTLAAATLAVLSPLLLIIAAVIKLSDGGSVLYRQERIGLLGKRFVCLKFRSMMSDAESALERHLAMNPKAREEWQNHQKLEDDPRITWLGRFLRQSSLDELPQLLNIIAGDMSLVGPRPITAIELDRYEERVGYYLAVKPGLTGLWQISGRSNRTYEERVDLDVRYAVTHSLWLDFIIMLKTVPAVISQRGSY